MAISRRRVKLSSFFSLDIAAQTVEYSISLQMPQGAWRAWATPRIHLASRLARRPPMSVTSEHAPASWIGTRDREPWLTEDWLSVAIGLLIFALALVALTGTDLLGWAVTTSVWADPGQALSTVSKAYASLGGAGALVTTYLALLVVLSVAAAALKANVVRFAVAFTVVFWIAYASWIVGSSAYV